MIGYAMKSSDVREHFSEFIDEVVHKSPKIVNRRRDHFMAINLQHIQPLVQNVILNAFFEQDEEGNFISSFHEITDLIGYGRTKEESLDHLIDDLIEYAQDYLFNSFSLYIHAPNRREHFPFVLKVMMQKEAKEVREFINVEY
ncbi:hypothetical protein [Paenibacillus sp. CECT 9249]|uniref:hypothetical protein n=1 Tax=Paenibacillus sp. CECT 9249 TaxID=2845385 RepID=UPI001E36AC2C|nr:hypothetical protein [Paenibacillus sp. CECT 9249]